LSVVFHLFLLANGIILDVVEDRAIPMNARFRAAMFFVRLKYYYTTKPYFAGAYSEFAAVTA